MTSKQRAYLKSLAMDQSAILQIGKSSLTPEITRSVDEALEARELIKIHVLKNCFDDGSSIAEVLAERTRAEVVQVIGKMIVLYRPAKEEKKRKIVLPKIIIYGRIHFMVNDEILYIRRRLKKKMDEDRFEHTIGVAYTSVCLAMRYGEDLHKAELAGLLHDCAKCIPDDIKLDKCKRNNIPITKAQEQSPSLLHAKLGAFIAADHYRIKDQDILNAIENHTTGRPAMSLLEKIVFVADYIEPRRNKASNLSKLRQMAFIDIDRTVYEIMDQTLRYLKSKKVPIDSLTKKSCDYYRALCGEKDVENETERN